MSEWAADESLPLTLGDTRLIVKGSGAVNQLNTRKLNSTLFCWNKPKAVGSDEMGFQAVH